MAEPTKLVDPYDDPGVSMTPDGRIFVETPEISVTETRLPDTLDPYDDPAYQNAAPGVKLAELANQQGKRPFSRSAVRGLAGAPGAPIDLLNFGMNLPKMGINLADLGVQKVHNWFSDDKWNLPPLTDRLPFEVADVELPGGSADMKNWLGAPPEVPAESAPGRVAQAGIEGALSSIGPGMVGGIGKKLLPNLFSKENVLREILAPSKGPLPNQIALDTTMGGTSGSGMQTGTETDSPYFGGLLALSAGLAPAGVVGARRLAREHLFGVTDPQEISRRLTENIGHYLPGDYRFNLANEIENAQVPNIPNLNLRPYQMVHDPFLGAIDTVAQRIDPVSMTNQENAAREAIRAHGEAGDPGGDPNLPKLLIDQRVNNLTNATAAREATVGTKADLAREQARADQAVEDWRIDVTHRADMDAAEKARIQQEQTAIAQYELEKANAANYADSVGAPDAATTRNRASQDIHESVVNQGEAAKSKYGGALGAYAEANDVKVPGEELLKLRARLQKQYLEEGTGGMPTFLKSRKNNPMESPTGDMLDDYLYTSPQRVDDAAAAGAVDKPQPVSVKQMIGWDKRLRQEESEAFLSGDTLRMQRTKQLRKEVNDIIDGAMGDTQYQALKEDYLNHVVKRFYTPTIDDFFTPKGLTPEEAGARAINAGRKQAQAAADTLKAIGNDPAGVKALVDFAASDMVAYAFKPFKDDPKRGVLDAGKLQRWINPEHGGMIAHLKATGAQGDAVAKQITDHLDDIQHNQTLLEATVAKAKENADADVAQIQEQFGGFKFQRDAQRAAEHRDAAHETAQVNAEQRSREQSARRFTQWGQDMVNRSAARFALGNDPEYMARGLLGSTDIVRDAESMKRLLRNDPDATKGMQQAIYDQFMTDAKVRLEKGGGKTQTEINEMLKPYQALEQKGLLPNGSTGRFRTMLTAEWHLNTPRAPGAQVDQDLTNRLMAISGASRGVGGSRFGNALTAAVRAIYGPRETQMIHKVLRDAALDPARMTELLRAEAKGQTELKSAVVRMLGTMGYKPTIAPPRE